MRTPLARAAQALPLGVVALGALAFVIGAGGTRVALPTLSSTAAAWRGLAGSARPKVDVGQRVIVMLKAPSLAQRVARAGGRASDSVERQWTTSALAAQQQVLATLAQHGGRGRAATTSRRFSTGSPPPPTPRAAPRRDGDGRLGAADPRRGSAAGRPRRLGGLRADRPADRRPRAGGRSERRR